MKNLPSGTTNLGQNQLDTPDFALVAETIFANSLQFRVPRNKPSMHEHSDSVRHALVVFRASPAHIGCHEFWSQTYRRADSKGRRGTL
jgi:hypothetical protein